MLSRAINGTTAFYPTLAGWFVLVGLHYLVAKLTLSSERGDVLLKGREHPLVKDGQVDMEPIQMHLDNPERAANRSRLV